MPTSAAPLCGACSGGGAMAEGSGDLALPPISPKGGAGDEGSSGRSSILGRLF
ncbi:hypothetical protein MNEG_15599, partial [Monoraphidium neglectum]